MGRTLKIQQVINLENVEAYLVMRDGEREYMIRAGSTTPSFSQRLGEHLKCSKLKRDPDRKLRLYSSSYPNEEASPEKDKDNSVYRPIGEWDDIYNYVLVIGWQKINIKQSKDLFEWDITTTTIIVDNSIDVETTTTPGGIMCWS